MKRRRRFFMAAGVTSLTGIAIASACGFPEPTLIDAANEAGPSSSSSSGDAPSGEDASVPKDATLADSIFAIDGNENVDPDGASQEAAVAPEAGLVDAAGCTTCDCDQDDAASEAGTCGGNDCNDLDPFIPHEGFVASKPNGHSGDWNCDGKVTKQFPVNVNCGALQNCNIAGFTGDPACGTAGEFITCKDSLLPFVLCEKASTETVLQGCK